MDPLRLMDLPDEMIQEICEGMPVSALENVVRTTTRVRELCRSILVKRRREVALGVLSAHGIDASTPELMKLAFFKAVEEHQKDVVRALLILGVSPNTTFRDRDTALHYVIRYTERHNVVASAAAADIARLLIRAGANPNATNEHGSTPLHHSVSNQGIETTRVLLAEGANPNIGDQSGETPLHVASRGTSVVLVELLLAAGANPNARDKHRRTPLGDVINKRVEKMLRDAGGGY